MARLHHESGDRMSFRLREMARLTDSIARDEVRVDEIIALLSQRGLLERSQESDNLIGELNRISVRIERDSISLSRLKSPMELTEEDQEHRPTLKNKEKFNIKY